MNAINSHNVNLKYLTEKYRLLSPMERIREFYREFRQEDALVTSSFGSSSAILLHHIAQVNPDQPIHFIDTTYLFEETHQYKEQISRTMGLKVISVQPEPWKNEFTKKDRTWEKDADLCCSVNKVEPLKKIRQEHKIWISGLMAIQTPFRKYLELFEKDGDIIKFYPLIDVGPYFSRGYINKYDLPTHPLVKEGFSSIGCTHCTDKGADRAGRWNDSGKSECGLHYTKDE